MKALHDSLTPGQREALKYAWHLWARPTYQTAPREFRGQMPPPGEWTVWLCMTGAGWGKTRVGAEWVIEKAKAVAKTRIALVGSTAKDAREVMWEGESGVSARCPPWWRPRFNVTDQCIEFPNGSLAFLYSAEAYEALRGPQHHFAWLDEPAKFRHLQETFDLMFHRLRLGDNPQVVLTTTPKRLSLLHKLVKDERTVITRGSTRDNAAFVPKPWLEKMIADYSGTTLGRQEIDGELFDDVPGALFAGSAIESARIRRPDGTPQEILEALAKRIGEPLRRIVVGVDPATTSKEESDACGIVVAALGRAERKDDDREHCYILEDATAKASPEKWARTVVDCVRRWSADCVVAETTLGGETIPALIRMVDDTVRVIEKGGNRGKRTRAEPVAAIYEQLRCHHVGMFAQLEDQMCQYTLDTRASPNNLDAAVYAVGELMLRERSGFSFCLD